MTASANTAAAPIGAPEVFHVTAMATFLIGAGLHAASLVIGPERLSSGYFTPRADIVFGALMLVSSIAGWLSLRRFAGTGALWWGFLFALALITISIPIHLRTLLTWSTAYITAFPWWYSAIEVPMFLGLAYLVTRFRWR